MYFLCRCNFQLYKSYNNIHDEILMIFSERWQRNRIAFCCSIWSFGRRADSTAASCWSKYKELSRWDPVGLSSIVWKVTFIISYQFLLQYVYNSHNVNTICKNVLIILWYIRTRTVRLLLETHPELVGPYTAYGGAMYTHTPLHLASRNGHR